MNLLSCIHNCYHHRYRPPPIATGPRSRRRSYCHWVESASSGRLPPGGGPSLAVHAGGLGRRHPGLSQRLRAHVWANRQHQQHDALSGREARRGRGRFTGASRGGAAGLGRCWPGGAFFFLLFCFFIESFFNAFAVASFVVFFHFLNFPRGGTTSATNHINFAPAV